MGLHMLKIENEKQKMHEEGLEPSSANTLRP